MKGAYSDSQQLFGQHLLNNLMPGHTYGHSSGGFPLKIPGTVKVSVNIKIT
jgi:Zn-dependent M16 (insulinase) family peptidase